MKYITVNVDIVYGVPNDFDTPIDDIYLENVNGMLVSVSNDEILEYKISHWETLSVSE